MNILFLSLFSFHSINDRGIYPDLLREFKKNHHIIYILSPIEKSLDKKELIICEENLRIVRVATGKIQKTNIIQKGINTLLIEKRFIKAIRKNFSTVRFDLVLYTTPPITFANVVKYIKKRDNAKTYLMLKDIFPQNAVDIGMMSSTGFMSLPYRYFRVKEKKLYAISDRIGCMSPANETFIIAHNPEIPVEKVKLCPNCIEVHDLSLTSSERDKIRKKYELPLDKKIFVYGGNLGKPQGISFIIKCLKTQIDNPNVFFLIIGSGTEYGKLQGFFDENRPCNMRLLGKMSKEDYDNMIVSCDIGLIFLDHKFKIPNFPSRILSYMQAGLPVLACTDPNTDIGRIIVEGGFGWWCESDDVEKFVEIVEKIINENLRAIGKKGFQYLNKHWNVKEQYFQIIKEIGMI